MRIAILEDDKDQSELIQGAAENLGHTCHVFDSGMVLQKMMRRDHFDLLILDWYLPDMSGLDVLKWVRGEEPPLATVPVLFVTNRHEESDVIEVLNAGADDYMIKPFSVPSLSARLNALLRRAYPLQQQTLVEFGDYVFDMPAMTLFVKGEKIEVKQKEIELAFQLFSKMGQLLSRQYLMDVIWGVQGDVNSRTLDTHVSRLRAKLNLRPENGYNISSIYSYGYRLEALEKPLPRSASHAPQVKDS